MSEKSFGKLNSYKKLTGFPKYEASNLNKDSCIPLKIGLLSNVKRKHLLAKRNQLFCALLWMVFDC